MNTDGLRYRDRVELSLLLAMLVTAPLDVGASQPSLDGRVLYARYCADCHGTTGRGDGVDTPLFDPAPSNLRAGVLSRYSTVDLARRVRTGKPLALALNLEALRQHAADVEALVAHLKRLSLIDWRNVEPGWNLYVDRCETCHGSSGKPTSRAQGPRVPRDLSDPAMRASMEPDALLDAVRHGRKGMPALTPRVSIEDGRQILAFFELLSPGFRIYSSVCASCHADDGRGVHSLGEVLGEELALPAVIFDQQFFAQRSAEQLRLAVSHMLTDHRPQMPHFRYVLTQPQLEAIIEYLKKDSAGTNAR